MQIDLVTTEAELSRLADDWNRLSRRVPFRSFEWLESWWRHYGAVTDRTGITRQLQVLVVREREQVVGIAPWYLESSLSAGRVLQFLGTGETYSDYLTVLAEPALAARVATKIAQWLTETPRGCWDALEFTGVDGEDRTTICLLVELETRGIGIVRRPDLHCWRIELPSTWEGYLSQLSKSHRKHVRRVERRIAEQGWRAWRAEGAAEVERALQLLVELHQKRHRSLGRCGAFASTAFEGFQAEVIRRLAQTGQLRLEVLELANNPIAVEYQLVGADVIYAYQAGIDPCYLHLEPGRASMATSIRKAIEEGYRAYDLLRGNEPYKAHWRALPRPTLRARAVAPHQVARLRNALWLAKDSAKYWVKQVLHAGSHE